MSTAISICTILLLLILCAAVVVLTVFIVKWLIEFTIFTRNLNDATVMIKTDLPPIMEELKQTLKKINELSENADNQVKAIKKSIATIIGLVSMFAGKFKFLSGTFFKGFQAAFNFFKKK